MARVMSEAGVGRVTSCLFPFNCYNPLRLNGTDGTKQTAVGR